MKHTDRDVCVCVVCRRKEQGETDIIKKKGWRGEPDSAVRFHGGKSCNAKKENRSREPGRGHRVEMHVSVKAGTAEKVVGT